MNISKLRRDYSKKKLNKNIVLPNPIEQFNIWLEEAIQSVSVDPTAMIITTVSPDNRPASRTVLLKDVSDGKFIFYTNYNSRKGSHLSNNPYASLTFYWPELERQVHVEGKVEKVDPATSDEYFASRPWKSRIGAIISPQSQPIENRQVIMKDFTKMAITYFGKKIKRPEHWGGYALTPDRLEFWQGRPNRLHDRILYTLQKDCSWNLERLAP